MAEIALPNASGEGGQAMIEAAFAEQDDEETPADDAVSVFDSLGRDMTTLSLIPRSRWQTLLHLDVIKVGRVGQGGGHG